MLCNLVRFNSQVSLLLVSSAGPGKKFPLEAFFQTLRDFLGKFNDCCKDVRGAPKKYAVLLVGTGSLTPTHVEKSLTPVASTPRQAAPQVDDASVKQSIQQKITKRKFLREGGGSSNYTPPSNNYQDVGGYSRFSPPVSSQWHRERIAKSATSYPLSTRQYKNPNEAKPVEEKSPVGE